MTNFEPEAARLYHERTKHSFESVRRSGHRLDWSNRPHPFKEYRGLQPVALPAELPEPGIAALDAIAAPRTELPAPLTWPQLARVLRWGAGVVRTRSVPGGEPYHFRTYSSAGALYPVEVYVAPAELGGPAPGLYHFHPRELVLRALRLGDVRESVASAADASELAEAGAVLVLSGILWRSAWKYQARAYRHLYWDAGTMLASLLAVAETGGLGPRLFTGFVDSSVNALVGVDGEREAALALLALGRADRSTAVEPLEPLRLEAAPLSAREVAYPEAYALHAASALTDAEEVRRYRAAAEAEQRVAALAPPDGLADGSLERVLRRRGSVRDFALEPIPAATLAAILSRAAAPVPTDVPASNETYLVVNAVDGLVPGAYRFEPPDRFHLLRPGSFRRQAGFLALEQPLAARAAATIFFMADLDRVLERLGNRGYRAAQLEAGVRSGRVYLGAYATRLGATASTFYDDAVSEFFGTSEAPMLCVAVGRR